MYEHKIFARSDLEYFILIMGSGAWKAIGPILDELNSKKTNNHDSSTSFL
jgi:hypothetical protein